MKAFLSYRYGDDVTQLINFLKGQHIDVVDSVTEMRIGSSLQDTILESIRLADFIVIVYSESNQNLAFEAGLATGLGKPVFSIIEGDLVDPFLTNTPYVRASPSDMERIKFTFEIFLTKLTKKEVATGIRTTQQKYYGGGEGIPTKNYFDVTEEYRKIPTGDGQALENFFERLFPLYGVKIVKKQKVPERSITSDFTIWYDFLSDTLGNPIMVEIKARLDPTSYPDFLLRINAIRNSNRGISMLVFYDGLVDVSTDIFPKDPTCLFIEIKGFIEQITDQGFASVVKKYRNNLIHQR